MAIELFRRIQSGEIKVVPGNHKKEYWALIDGNAYPVPVKIEACIVSVPDWTLQCLVSTPIRKGLSVIPDNLFETSDDALNALNQRALKAVEEAKKHIK